MLSLQPLTPKQQQTMIDRRLTEGSAATKFFKNLVDFRESRALQDSLHAENFALGRIERLKEIKGDEKQYVAETGGRLVDNQTALFERAGHAKPVFDAALRQIAEATGTTLKLAAPKGTKEGCVDEKGQLQNAVPRLAVKAWDDELKRLQEAGEVGKDNDGQVPLTDKVKVATLLEAWKAGATVDKSMPGLAKVKDVVRASLMCDSEEQMGQVCDALCANPLFGIARFKNFFANLCPTHFRRIGLNLRVQLPDGGSHVCELQLHHTQIYENAPDHKVYEYFRDVFVGSEFDGKMDDLIGKRMKHLEDVMQVPVFMSLLIVCVDGGDDGAVPEVPATVAELYQTAMTKLYQQRGDRDGFDGQQMQRLMRAVFTQNQLRRRRQFGHADVVSALQDATSAAGAQDSFDELMVLWNRRVDEGAAPFVKILVKPGGSVPRGDAQADGAHAQAGAVHQQLLLHPTRRGGTQLYAVPDLCTACDADGATAGAFATGLGPTERHDAHIDEIRALRDQGVELAEPEAVASNKHRGRVFVVGEGNRSGSKYVGQCGLAVQGLWDEIWDSRVLHVTFEGGGDDYFELSRLKVAEEVVLLDGDAATALLRHCSSDTAVEALTAYLANTGLFQATHLSLQESECAEALHQTAVDPNARPVRMEGLMKWFLPAEAVSTFLNDGWYSNTLGLVRAPPTAEGHRALVSALFPQQAEHDSDHLTIGGFANKSLSSTGIQTLFSLGRSLEFKSIDLTGALADGVTGASEVAAALQVQLLPVTVSATVVFTQRASFLQEDSGSLSRLDVSGNRLCGGWIAGYERGMDDSSGLIALAKSISNLKELNISSNLLKAEGARILAPAIEASGALVSLNLADNELGRVGIKFIAEVLPKW
jgi:hypothetical protein